MHACMLSLQVPPAHSVHVLQIMASICPTLVLLLKTSLFGSHSPACMCRSWVVLDGMRSKLQREAGVQTTPMDVLNGESDSCHSQFLRCQARGALPRGSAT